jgi:hypothetical protein
LHAREENRNRARRPLSQRMNDGAARDAAQVVTAGERSALAATQRRRTLMRKALVCLLLATSLPALADSSKKAANEGTRRAAPARSLSDCTSFDQSDKNDTTVSLTIRNACTVPVDCSVSWRVVCAPESKKRRAVHPGSQKLALVEGTSSSADASATICGDDAWQIDSIEWSCQPNKD